MPGPHRWVAAGALLVVAGTLTAVSTWRHWALCRADLASLRCAALEDATHGFPGWGEATRPDLGAAATAILAAVILSAVWVGMVGWDPRSLTHNLRCVIVGVQPLVAAAALVAESVGRPIPTSAASWLTWPAEAYVFPLLLGAGWLLHESARGTARLLALGWAVTSFGPFHHFGDYVIARVASPQALGSSPPGLGYATAATQFLLGFVVILLTVHNGPTGRPDSDEWPGRDGFTLAA